VEHLSGTEAPIEGRLRLIGALVTLVFALFVGRLFELQILEGAVLQQRSARNSVRTVRLEAARGEIVDRAGRVLATTRPAFELQVVPNDLKNAQLEYEALGQLLSRDPEQLREAVGQPRGRSRFQPVTLADDLDWQQLARVETHRFALPGVETRVRPRRYYPQGQLVAHLLGSIGEVRQDQLEKASFAGYRAGDVVGQSGLESRYESHLHGHAGGRNVVVDAAGREVEVLDEVAQKPGDRLVLALDLDLQRAAAQAFADVPEGEPERIGAAVALDVHNGDVLALVSRPAYDPNDFAGGIDAETWQKLRDDPLQPLRDRAIQDHYPPGSTHKAVVAEALLAAGVITAETQTFCPGYFRYGRRTYRCWKRGGHGWMNVVQALKQSCDVFFYTHGVELGIDRLAHFAKSFGLGRRTGIDLPGEASGLVPSSSWKKEHFHQVWFPGETVSASIGQGYNLYTPIQLAVSYAALANGGKVMKPRLVLRLESQDGEVQTRVEAQQVGHADVTAEALALVQRGLTAAVEEPGGTGGRARVPGMLVAGKTGTAQVVGLERTQGMKEEEIPFRFRDHAWFAAFAPADNPQLAVAVFIEHGRHGSSGAGPVVRRILARWHEEQLAAGPPTLGGG